MSEPFYQHLFPSRYRVLGQWLPPLSLWQLASLEAIGSPFLSRGASVDLADIQIATRICLTRWPKQPAIKPSIRDAWQAFRHRYNKRKVQEEGRRLQAHISAYSSPPRMWQSMDDATSHLTAPHVMLRVAGLAKLGCFSLSEIWNDITPGFSLWLLLTIAEREGADIRFWQEGDDDEVPELEIPQTESGMRAFAKSQGLTGGKLENFIEAWRRNRRGK